MANGNQEKRSGLITRKRTTVDGSEISAIDFIIFSQDMDDSYVSLNIDEEQKYSLTSCTMTKKGPVIKESDHNTLVCKFSFKYNPQNKKHKYEIFNFKDIEGLKKN